MDKVGQFLNDALRPWDKLNKVLAEPFAYQPDLSDATREAVTIAAAIKHVAVDSGNKLSHIPNQK